MDQRRWPVELRPTAMVRVVVVAGVEVSVIG